MIFPACPKWRYPASKQDRHGGCANDILLCRRVMASSMAAMLRPASMHLARRSLQEQRMPPSLAHMQPHPCTRSSKQATVRGSAITCFLERCQR